MCYQVSHDDTGSNVEEAVALAFGSDDGFHDGAVHEEDEDEGYDDESDLLDEGISSLDFTAVEVFVVFDLKKTKL